MKKSILVMLAVILLGISANAQREEEEVEKTGGFQKERLFTGGSVSLSLGNRSFLIGASPMFGYSISDWLDAGVTLNFNYTSFRDISFSGDKLHETVYGGGPFVKLYPIRFLFVQGQFEHNFIRAKYFPGGGSNATTSVTRDANSLLLGAGFSSGREPQSGRPFFYLSILFDVLNSENSPYADAYNRMVPIFRAGVQVPIFQGRRFE